MREGKGERKKTSFDWHLQDYREQEKKKKYESRFKFKIDNC